MNKLRYVMKSITVLNCLLILLVAAAAYYVVVPFLNLKIQVILPAAATTEAERAAQPAAVPNPAFSEYAAVSEQNLFHPERKIPPEKKGAEEKILPPPKPDLLLYGTLISDDLSIAYIEDKKSPYTTPGRGIRQTEAKKGSDFSGYILREIEPDRIVLVKGEEKLVVMLTAKEKKRSGETAAPAPGASGGAPTRPAAPSPPRAGTGSFPSAASASSAVLPMAASQQTNPPIAAQTGTSVASQPAAAPMGTPVAASQPTTDAAAPAGSDPHLVLPLTRRPFSIQDLLKLKSSPLMPKLPAGN